MLRLHDFWLSSSAWRVRIALHLKGLPFETVPVDLFADEQLEEGYGQRNALRQVPLLCWDDAEGQEHRLSQSLAIIDHLDSLAPEPRLIPDEPDRRARALQLTEIVNAGIQPLQNRYVLSRIEAMGGDGKAFAAHFIERGLRALETTARPTAGRFLVGDRVTIADVFLIPQLAVARRMKVALDAMPTLRDVETRCLELEPFRAADPKGQPGAPA